MSFYQLVCREMQGSLPRLFFMSSLGGISNAAILAAINAGAQAAGSGKVSIPSAVLFVVAIFIYIKAQNYVLISTTAEIEAIIHKLRLRLMDQVRRSELAALEGIGRAEIVAAITRETAILTQASTMFAISGQGVVLLVFVAVYIAYLSPLAFALSVLIIGIASALFLSRSRQLTIARREAGEWENQLFDRLTDLLDGFKEVRLDKARSDALFADIAEVSRTAANIKIRSETEQFKRLVFSQSSLYVLLGAIVFVVPTFSTAVGESIVKTTTALLFVIASCWGLVQTIPVLAAANLAAKNIEQLEARLRATVSAAEVSIGELTMSFEKIEMRNVVFRYVDKFSDAAFQIGPLDFSLRRGELVFITGGNGSGKSTFLKVLSGLYAPNSGELTLDEMQIGDGTREIYRALISAVFTDYHLFQKLYGIPDPDRAEIDRLLTLFRLRDKTGLTDGEFRTLNLSGGQRKRLALIVSLLEKRPILLLDEWTADQDPEFRQKFYNDLLPQLMQAGATMVIVTHDDRYLNELHLPSRRMRMDEGRFVEQRSMESV